MLILVMGAPLYTMLITDKSVNCWVIRLTMRAWKTQPADNKRVDVVKDNHEC